MRKLWILGVGALSFGLSVVPAFGQIPAQKAGDLPGPIDSISDVQDTGRMLFKLADENNDGQISQKEALDAGNLLVGGFFFRADQNGDGVLSQDEEKQAREAFLSTKPWLRYAVGTAKAQLKKDNAANNSGNKNQNVLAALEGTFDTNNDKQLQASELRQSVQSVVQGGFAVADTNRDGQLSPTEVNAAIAGAGRQVADAAFQQSDADGNGQISQEEFLKAIDEPARVAFAVMDLNHDGQISREEAKTARQLVASKLRQSYLPEPSNSPRNQTNSALGSSTNEPVSAPAAPR